MPTPKQNYIDSIKGKAIMLTKKGSDGAIIIQKKPPQKPKQRGTKYA